MYYEKAIEVERVSKLYKIYKKPSDRLLAKYLMQIKDLVMSFGQ